MATARREDKPILALGIQASYREIELRLIDRNPNQPRQDFDDDGNIADLSKSIKANTLLQAITVRAHPKITGRYMIVAGERRFRALVKAGVTKAVFKLIEGEGVERSYILSAIENLQRVNLNPIEEATTYQRLHDEEHMSWEEIHNLLGRDVSVILTKIKLLTLPPKIQQMVRKGELPQVTALNLSQWRNEEGEYLRLAHDLIAGRDPAVIHFHKETAQGQRLVQAKLPRTPDEFARRIVKLSGHVQSMPAVLEAFLRLTPKEQTETFNAIHPAVLGKLRVRFVALYRAIQAVSERMNAFDAEKNQRVALEPEPLPPEPSPDPYELAHRVLSALLYAGGNGHPSVNLSKADLQEELRIFDDVSNLVREAVKQGRENWRIAPYGSDAQQKLIRLMHRIRRDYGGGAKLDDCLRSAMQDDRSEDPVRLI